MRKEEDLENVFSEGTEGLLDEKLGSMVLQFVSYNPNMEYVTICSVIFRQRAVGMIESRVVINYMQTDLYKGTRIARVIVEILYILLTIYYLKAEVTQWLTKQAEIRENARQEADDFKEKPRFERFIWYLGFDYDIYKDDSLIVKMLKVLLGLVVLLFRWLFYFLKVTYFHLTQDFFNMLDSCSLILSLINIFYWFSIIFKFYLMPDNPNYIGEFQELGKTYQQLKLVIGVNSLIIFLRLLQFFKFNKKLSVLSDVISSASTDAGFFLLMFTIVLLGFSIWGNSLFGLKNEKFSSIFKATHTFFIMVTGDADYDELVESGDPQLAPVFFLVFMVLFNLLLLNMFIAIISQHYEQIHQEIKEKQQQEKGEQQSMILRICSLIGYRCSKRYKRDLKIERGKQHRLCIFCIRCCGKGNEPTYIKDIKKKQLDPSDPQNQGRALTSREIKTKVKELAKNTKFPILHQAGYKKKKRNCCAVLFKRKRRKLRKKERMVRHRKGKTWHQDTPQQVVDLQGNTTPRTEEDQKNPFQGLLRLPHVKREDRNLCNKIEQEEKEEDDSQQISEEEEEEKVEIEISEENDDQDDDDEFEGSDNFAEIFRRQKASLDQRELKKLKQIIDIPQEGGQPIAQRAQQDLLSQTSWLRVLESALKKVSHDQLKLNEFAARVDIEPISQNFNHNFTNLEMAYLKESSPSLLENREASVLYSVFRSLRYMALKQDRPPAAKDQQLTVPLFHRTILTKFANNSRAYRRFWDYLEEEDQIELWLHHFNNWDRVALWNALPFGVGFLIQNTKCQHSLSRHSDFADILSKKVNEDDEEELYEERNMWEYLFVSEVKNNAMLEDLEFMRKNYTKYLVSSHRVVKKKDVEIKWIEKIRKMKLGQNRFNSIKRNYLNDGECRIPLWFALDRKQRMSLVKSQTHRQEACFMLLLLMEEHKDEESVLKQIGIELEMELDDLIYNRYSLLCQWQAVRAQCLNGQNLLNNAREEDDGLIDYLRMLEDKLSRLKEQKKTVSVEQTQLMRVHQNSKRKLTDLILKINPDSPLREERTQRKLSSKDAFKNR